MGRPVMRRRDLLRLTGLAAGATLGRVARGQDPRRPEDDRDRGARPEAEATFPPTLPGGQEVVTDRTRDFLRTPATLRAGVAIAETPPTVDFLLFPGQTYPGKPW